MLIPQKVIQILRTSFSRWGNRGLGRERVRMGQWPFMGLCPCSLAVCGQEFLMYRSPELLFLVSIW